MPKEAVQAIASKGGHASRGFAADNKDESRSSDMNKR
jgi:hypothetical protein